MKVDNISAWLPRAAVGATAAFIVTCVVAGLVIEQKLRDAGRDDLITAGPAMVTAFILALAGSAVVGSVLAIRKPGNPAGWLFLALALSLSGAALAESYAAYGAVYDPRSLPAAKLAAVYADGAFLPWISILTLILLVTPTGGAPGPRWKIVGWMAGLSGVLFLIAIAFRSEPIDSTPFVGFVSPFSNHPFAGAFSVVADLMIVSAHLALVGSLASMVVRVRRARGDERRQLRWLMVPAIPFPFFVFGAWAAAQAGNEELLGLLGGSYLAIIPVAAALAIEKQRLYDIDRIVSRTVAYTLLSGLVVASYIAIVLVAGVAGGRASAESVPAAVAATLVAVAVGGFGRRKLQDAVDRKFNRRAFTALERVNRFIREPDPQTTIEAVLAEAAEARSLRVGYWNDQRAAWVSEDGTARDEPPVAAVMAEARDGGTGAAITWDERAVSRDLIAALAEAARPELENARLRAAIQLQLVEVRESRARIVAAQVAERRRIERDLHDGSQQRLLALAMNLRATELAGDSSAALAALPGAIDEIQSTVRELRELAAGLYPGALEDGGLPAAFRELAARTPIPVRLSVVERRLPPPIESSAWFIACEAITNVVKHARARSVALAASFEDGALVLSIDDDGIGGADSNGHGLRGIADRAEAAGGSVSVISRPAGGTSVRAVLPCER